MCRQAPSISSDRNNFCQKNKRKCRQQGTSPPQAVPLPFQGRLLRCSIQKGSPERGAGTRSVTEGLVCFPAEIIFIRKRLVNARKTWYEWYNISIEANKKAGHGRCPSPMPLLCRRSVVSYIIAFATPVPIITVFPLFVNSQFSHLHGN